ncbi:MAG: bifunctional 4-hydroxy-2-oxoglutarate aldolase/2-dehydro-3-deoxy-phosphogluconate aldolase [Burkholderiaceae bacterium]
MVNNTLELAEHGPVIPVIVIDDAARAVDLASALIAGGIRVLEITLRTPAALDAIKAVAQQVPRAIVGAGTVRTADDAARAKQAGASFAVSPGLTPAVAKGCASQSLPLLPGIATAGEVMAATEAGFTFLKFFPANAIGGIPLLSSLASPFPDVSFCPTGGIGPVNAADYLALPNVRCVGGSWLVPAKLIESADWNRITELASAASQLSGVTPGHAHN